MRAGQPGLSQPRPEVLLFDFGGTLDSDGEPWKERFYRIWRHPHAEDILVARKFRGARRRDAGRPGSLLSGGVVVSTDRAWGIYRELAHSPGRGTDDALILRAVAARLEELARRGVARALLQEHVAGDLVKFYGVAAAEPREPAWFQWFYHREQAVKSHPFDPAMLRRAAETAAAALDLEVWGGYGIVPAGGDPVVIDLNAWPSFALFRETPRPGLPRGSRRVLNHTSGPE